MAIALVASALLAGCGTAEPSRSGSAPSAAERTDPASADTLVLRWRLTGGFAGIGGQGSPPDFSLYGDGRAIVPEKGNPASLREYRLKPEVVRRLTDEARAAGLDRARRTDQPGGIADAFTLVITFGSARTFIVYPEARKDPPVQLWRRLDPTRWAASDQAAPSRPYTPTRMAVLADPAPGGGGRAKTTQWPLPPLDRGTPGLAAGRCQVVGGGDVGTAIRLSRTAAPDTRWRSGDTLYSVRFRPMLPDEHTCADLTRA
jgi:hypothetical protein